MKVLFFTLLACLATLASTSYAACYQASCYKSYSTSYQSNCQCTDPACYGSNNCLDRAKCCRAFGNIGSMEDDMPI